MARGMRWVSLINAMGYKSRKINSISAVSIGYLANLFIPRAGEIIRCTSLAKSDNIPVEKLFGTILIERVIDMVLLMSLIIVTVTLKFGAFTTSYHHYQNLGSMSALIIIHLQYLLNPKAMVYPRKQRIILKQ